MAKQNLSEQLKRMQKLAGLVKENNENSNIDNLIKYLEESISYAQKLKAEGPNEMQDFGSLIASIEDGLNQFK